MPRKNPLSRPQREVCRRLKLYRESTGLSRVVFAARAGIATPLLRSYETGSSQLNYAAACKIISAFPLSPTWLYDESGPMVAHLKLPEPEEINARKRASFIDVFERLKEANRVFVESLPRKDQISNPEIRWRIWHRIRLAAAEWIAHVPDNKLNDFHHFISQAVDKEIASYGFQSPDQLSRRGYELEQEEFKIFPFLSKSARLGPPSINSEIKEYLDNKKRGVIVSSVNAKEVPTWGQLKKTIAKLTDGHGQKAALADELGVSRQVLGNWLSDGDQGAPNAELTLRLFKWSLDPKRQQMK